MKSLKAVLSTLALSALMTTTLSVQAASPAGFASIMINSGVDAQTLSQDGADKFSLKYRGVLHNVSNSQMADNVDWLPVNIQMSVQTNGDISADELRIALLKLFNADYSTSSAITALEVARTHDNSLLDGTSIMLANFGYGVRGIRLQSLGDGLFRLNLRGSLGVIEYWPEVTDELNAQAEFAGFEPSLKAEVTNGIMAINLYLDATTLIGGTHHYNPEDQSNILNSFRKGIEVSYDLSRNFKKIDMKAKVGAEHRSEEIHIPEMHKEKNGWRFKGGVSVDFGANR